MKSLILLPSYNGSDSYHAWSQSMEVFLKSWKLWWYVNGTIPKPEPKSKSDSTDTTKTATKLKDDFEALLEK